MPIPLPNLDDRRWADLVDEGRALIPLYAPEWTDHNLHDPGITLIELLAWIAEMDIYQLNRIPEQHKRKFLALVGITPAPPCAARTVLGFTLADSDGTLSLPAALECVGDDPHGQATHFRTLEALTIVPGGLQVVQIKDARGLHDCTAHWRRSESIPIFGAIPQRDAELYLGFSHAWPVAAPVSLYFTFAGPRTGEDERRRLIAEMRARKRACRPPFADSPCTPEMPPPSTSTAEPEKVPIHHGVRLEWEVLTAAGAQSIWRTLGPSEVDDETRALTLDGRARLQTPVVMAQPQENSGLHTDCYYLRIRFAAGAYDAPPLLRSLTLNGVAAEQAVPVGTVHAMNDQSIEAVLLGTSNGAPYQELALPLAPAQVTSFRLFTVEDSQWHTWRLRSDFESSTRRDADFLLNPTTGAVMFGDGEHGRVPLSGVQIYAAYHATRAEAGNLATGTIKHLSDSAHNHAALGAGFQQVKARLAAITNPIAATGGAAAETLSRAIGRAIELLETPQRAVTLRDYEILAMQTPGASLARVTARANLHPSFPCLRALGMVTVMILPNQSGPRPTPSPGLLQAVAAYLNLRRIIGTRVEVVAPSYLEVAVRAKVRACAGVSKTNLQHQIMQALNNFLHPLTGGPAGSGWPFGRDVYRAEILQVIDEVPGVDHVLGLELVPEGCTAQCGNVCLRPTWLVAAGQHEIAVN